MSTSDGWEVTIGLEIHVQLKTSTKIFSGASIKFGAEPNTQACAIDLGMPGVLPAVNAEVYPKAVAFGLGVGAKISMISVFDRKNYFYPDLPKGYQITQMDYPIVAPNGQSPPPRNTWVNPCVQTQKSSVLPDKLITGTSPMLTALMPIKLSIT